MSTLEEIMKYAPFETQKEKELFNDLCLTKDTLRVAEQRFDNLRRLCSFANNRLLRVLQLLGDKDPQLYKVVMTELNTETSEGAVR